MKNYNSNGIGLDSLHNSDAEGILGDHSRSVSNARNGRGLDDSLSRQRSMNSRGSRMSTGLKR